MGISYKVRTKYINVAKQSNILPCLLRYRLQMGFPYNHLAASELIDGHYHHGEFEQGDNTPKKSLKNTCGLDEVPHVYPQHDVGSLSVEHAGVVIIRKKSKLKNKVDI